LIKNPQRAQKRELKRQLKMIEQQKAFKPAEPEENPYFAQFLKKGP